jgi:hypothetical protein
VTGEEILRILQEELDKGPYRVTALKEKRKSLVHAIKKVNTSRMAK